MQVEVDAIVNAQKAVVSSVQSAVQDALASAPSGSGIVAGAAKRSAGDAAQPSKAGPAPKKPKMLAALETFGSDESDLSSDEDDE